MVGGYVTIPIEIIAITKDLKTGESKVVPGIYNTIKEYYQLGKLVMAPGNERNTPVPMAIAKGTNSINFVTIEGDVMFIVTEDDVMRKP